MAELTTAEKNAVSHRALAIRALRPSLVALVEKRLRDAVRLCST